MKYNTDIEILKVIVKSENVRDCILKLYDNKNPGDNAYSRISKLMLESGLRFKNGEAYIHPSLEKQYEDSKDDKPFFKPNTELTREEKVENFMKTMGQPIHEHPSTTPLSVRQLAIKLTFEELRELSEALDVRSTFGELCDQFLGEGLLTLDLKDGDNVDPVEAIDAFGDIAYTNYWGVVATGLKKVFGNAFSEICRSNDSKACDDLAEADATIAFHNGKGEKCIAKAVGDKYIVLNESGKVKKSVKYSPADLKPYV